MVNRFSAITGPILWSGTFYLIVERLHYRPVIGQAVALTEDVRSLTRDASRELDRVGAVTDRVDDIATAVGRIVGTLSGLTRAGPVVRAVAGIR